MFLAIPFHLTAYDAFVDDDNVTHPPEVAYTPRLEQAPLPSKEFIEKIGYLATGFSFSTKQMHLFLSALNEITKAAAAQAAEESEEEEDESDEATEGNNSMEE